jgi:uncharacterized membrane protein YkvA (DUF1232 family)
MRRLPVRWKEWAKRLKRETRALVLAYRDPATPWYARLWAAVVVAYALSPIDLIPDFIPILGWLDDLVLIPLGVALAVRMIPPEVMARCRRRAETEGMSRSRAGRIAAAAVILVWLAAIGLVVRLVFCT